MTVSNRRRTGHLIAAFGRCISRGSATRAILCRCPAALSYRNVLSALRGRRRHCAGQCWAGMRRCNATTENRLGSGQAISSARRSEIYRCEAYGMFTCIHTGQCKQGCPWYCCPLRCLTQLYIYIIYTLYIHNLYIQYTCCALEMPYSVRGTRQYQYSYHIKVFWFILKCEKLGPRLAQEGHGRMISLCQVAWRLQWRRQQPADERAQPAPAPPPVLSTSAAPANPPSRLQGTASPMPVGTAPLGPALTVAAN